MERRYSPEEFGRMVDRARAAIPGVTITTDAMVGFPGETDQEFDDGYHFIQSMRFDGMHVFKYSQRSGTRAARLPDQVREEVKSKRSRLLRDEAAAGVCRLLARHVGNMAAVVWEGDCDGVWRGLTDTNVRVYGSLEVGRPGRVSRVRLASPFRDGLWSEPVGVEIPLTVQARNPPPAAPA
jgi:threonylcarbamoyladenosine tRNA methylthiotransferase MtaB